MTLADFAPACRVPLPPRAGLVNAIAGWFAAWRARRAQQTALQVLLFAPEYRLRDLGISREELVLAMEIHRK